MTEPRPKEEMKRHAAIGSLAEEHFNLEIATLLNLFWNFPVHLKLPITFPAPQIDTLLTKLQVSQL